jgi:predicted dehydrogenase
VDISVKNLSFKIHMKKSRRSFLINSSKLVAASSLAGMLPSVSFSRIKADNNNINIALIGANNMGYGDIIDALRQPNVTCAAICDIDDAVLQKRIPEIEKIQGKKPLQYKDHRKLLENKDIDAVIIATPDHWHCQILIDACAAGKDVYVEKPIANSIYEADLMVKAVRSSKCIVQVGQQQRSGDHWKSAMDFMKEGKLGDIRKIQVWANFNYGIGQPKLPDSPVPPGVDFDRWLGPAPKRSFNKNRFHGSWRMFWDYGGGLMTDWGVHLMDMALWAKDTRSLPLSVSAVGGNYAFPDHAHETFDTMSVHYAMPDHTISYEHAAGTETGPYGKSYGLAFTGNNGTIVIDRGSWDLLPEGQAGKTKISPMPKQMGTDPHATHLKNWIDCIRSRQEPVCPIETGRLAAVYCHMGNVALRSRSTLIWNEATHNFGANNAANAFIKP